MKKKSSFSDNIHFIHEPQRIIRINDMLNLLFVSRTTLWRWVKEGHFPEPHKMHGKTLGWTVNQYHEWLSRLH